MTAIAHQTPACAGVQISTASLWAGRIISGFVVAFLAFDGAIKLIPLDIVIETSVQLGIPTHLARTLGVLSYGRKLVTA